MEESVNLPELEAILDAARKREHRDRKFTAALKGVDLEGDEQREAPSFEQIERKARAILSGQTEEQVELSEIGMGLETEEE